jgi:hypothetical protein
MGDHEWGISGSSGMCFVVSARYLGRPVGRPYHYGKVNHTTVRKDPLCLGASARILQGALSDALTSTTKSAIQLFEKILRASAPPRVITGALSDALTTTTKSAIQLFEKILCASAPPRAHRDHPVQPHATPLRSLRAIFRIHSIFVFRKRTADATEMV